MVVVADIGLHGVAQHPSLPAAEIDPRALAGQIVVDVVVLDPQQAGARAAALVTGVDAAAARVEAGVIACAIAVDPSRRWQGSQELWRRWTLVWNQPCSH